MTAETGAASSRTATPGDPFTVLFVCTGNICRSAMAEVFARRELASHPGLEVPLRFSSAGSYAMEGNRAVEASAVAAEARGASLERHRARQLTRRRVAAADLILCPRRLSWPPSPPNGCASSPATAWTTPTGVPPPPTPPAPDGSTIW